MPKLVFKSIVEYEVDFDENAYSDIPEVTNYHSAVNWELTHNSEQIVEWIRESGVIRNIEGFVKD